MRKITIFGVFWGRKATFLSISGEIWHESAVLGLSPQVKYCKNGLRGQILGKFIKKYIPILAILEAVLPHFLTDSDTI